MAHQIKSFDLNAGDVQFLYDQATFRTLKIVGYDHLGTPIYGWIEGSGPFAPVLLDAVQAGGGATIQVGGSIIHTLGAAGAFDPLNPAFNHYDGARDYEGLRNVSGQFNNLVEGQNSWGSANELFLRLTNGDYAHYSTENLTSNAAPGGALDPLAHKDPYTGLAFGGVTNGVTSQADYSDPTKGVVDYTPRMITQTISSQAAMDRLGVSTDSTSGTRLDFDASGQLVPQTYTENFIENTNSYAADPSYSGWFVLFGQFFDHGLDFIAKPNTNALIEIPLAVDDPLYNTIGPDGQKVTSIKIARATVSNSAAAGADGKFGTADDVKDPGADKIYGTADDVHGPTSAQYGNSDSPYIDQNQTYGSSEQITQLLREWIPDPNHPGQFIAGAALLDGHSVKDPYLSTAFSDRGVSTGQGQGLTDRTLPTLDELRAALLATGRDDLTWEDIANFRIRDAHGDVMDMDGNAANGVQSAGVGQAIILDMNPRFDAARLNPNDNDFNTSWDSAITGKVNDAIAYLSAHLPPGATFGIVDGKLTLHLPAGMMGPDPVDLTGVGAMSLWVNPVDNSILAKAMGDPNPMSDAMHDAVSQIMLASIGDHYVAGDGRANENFGLTTVHHVFHEDHNYQVVNLEAQILATKDVNHKWQVKTADQGAPTVTSGEISTADPHYTGVNYHFSNLTFNAAVGSYTATISNILDAKGNVVMDGAAPLTLNGVYVDKAGHISWNLDMMFDAAKLVVEMEYQHVAIDQYARFVTPDLPEFVTYDANINANISMEYAQAAFRFGHSQLRDTIDAIETQGQDGAFDVTGTITKYALQAAFLNPGAFADAGPGAIALGMSHQVGNETDEFVTPALQQNLLNQPLDLAAINIARARDLGAPTLNEVRKQLYDAIVAERNNPDTLSAQPHAKIQLDLLSPYNSWSEFGGSMIHPESLVNFIAAYSFDGDLAKAQAMVGLDDGSITEGSAAAMGFTAQEAFDFMAGALDPATGHVKVAGADGFNSVDLWIGGLAESHVLGGILGPTFNAIFEDQMERLMDGDRFYYLYRLFLALPEITNLDESIVNEQFKDIVERTTGVQHLNGDIMLYADSYVELGNKASAPGTAMQTEHKYADQLDALHSLYATDQVHGLAPTQGVYSAGGNGVGGNGQLITIQDPEHPGTYLTYVRDVRPDNHTINSNGNPIDGYNSHEVIAGTKFNDYIDAGDGDDTIYGGDGNDILIGNGGSDHIYGEAGDDVIYGAGGKAGADVIDFLDGGDGNDYIYGGENAGATEILIGGRGDDHLYAESGIDEVYGGDGNDYIDGGGDTDLLFGDAGNDEMHGGDGPDIMNGGSGSDLISGGSGSDKLAGEEGDDILYGGQGGGVAQGDSDELWGGDANNVKDDGFDIAAYSDSSIKLDVAADLNNVGIAAGSTGVAPEPYNNMYVGIEGVIGSKFDDVVAATAISAQNPQGNAFGAGLVGDGNGNWLIGGSGSDRMQGQGGDDVIVGGSIRLADLDAFLAKVGFAQHFNELLTSRPDFVLGDDGTNANKGADTAVLGGKLAEYKVEALDANGVVVATSINGVITNNGDLATIYAIRVTDSQATRTFDGGATSAPGDGVDILIGVNKLQFADKLVDVGAFFDVAPTLDLHHVMQAQNQTVASDNFDAFLGIGNGYSRGSGWAGAWTEGTTDPASGNAYSGGQIQVVQNGLTAAALRFGSGDGATVQRAVDLSGKANATISFSVTESNFAANETVKVWFAADGVNFVLEKTFNASTNNGGTQSFTVAAPAGGFSTAAQLKFEVSAVAGASGASAHTVTIDNVNVTSSVTVDQFPGNNYAIDYFERANGVAIAASPSIADPDGQTIVSATIHIRDGVAGDVLTAGTLPAGITATGNGSDTITLSGLASHAAYETALAAISFSNATNHDPTGNSSTATRHVDVTVNDGFRDSAVATTTVTVHAVDDPTILSADTVVTNIGTGTTSVANIVIPDWALLANDTDPDSTPTIATIGGANSLTISGSGLGHANSQVTIRDIAPNDGSFTYHVNGSSPDATVSVKQDLVGTLDGTAGSDVIVGKATGSVIDGHEGNDIIFVGAGLDTITGGAGSDTFVFRSTAEAGNGASRDVIQDFAQFDPANPTATHDTIDLSAIDANTGQIGSQAFLFDSQLTGAAATTGNVARGHLGYYYVTVAGVEHTILTGNTNATSGHDVQIDLVGHHTFTTAGLNHDLIL